VLDVPDPAQMKALREKYQADWFLAWRSGKAYGIPRSDSPSKSFGIAQIIACDDHDHMHLLTARLNDVLPQRFPKYNAFRRRPFAFLGLKEEIVASVTRNWENLSPLIREFKIRPRFELDPRIIELSPGQTEIAIFLKMGLNWSIPASIEKLQEAGIDLAGLHVVRRDPGPDERRLVGTIKCVNEHQVILSDSFEDLASIETRHVQLEGSKASFARCFHKLLGSRYQDFEVERYRSEGEFLLGPSLKQLLDRMREVLQGDTRIQLAPDLTCDIDSTIEVTNTPDYQTVSSCGAVQYCFDAARAKRHELAWAGLTKFGPFDRDTFPKRTPRILVVSPNQCAGKVSQFIRTFRDGIQSELNSRFAKGFAGTFGLVNPQFVTCEVPTLGTSESRAADAYVKAIEDHLASASGQYDLALVVILDQHSNLPDLINPYLRGKAVLLMNGIPVQDVRLNTIIARPSSLQYTLQNLAVAMYAKMGGTPWTVAHDLTVDDEVVIGMGNVELSGSRFEQKQRFMGITTVFRGDGNYLLSNVSRVCRYDEYPGVLEVSMAEVLREVKKRNGWQDDDTVRVVFHAHKPLRRVEVATIVERCVREVGAKQNIQFAFLTVTHDHPFKVLDTSQAGIAKVSGTKGVYAPNRGIIVQLGRYTRLLATNGPSQIKRDTSPLPSPLLIHLHRESTYVDLQYLPEQVLKFTSLTWRSTQPAYAPVTIYYSELIAALLSRLKEIPDWSPAVLNTKLRFSRWFL
jgi:argonaute-like protein implicated in RNA metabolism and viral defense